MALCLALPDYGPRHLTWHLASPHLCASYLCCMYIHSGGTCCRGQPKPFMPALLLCARACKVLCPVPFVWTAVARLKTTATLLSDGRGPRTTSFRAALLQITRQGPPPDSGASCTIRCDAIAKHVDVAAGIRKAHCEFPASWQFLCHSCAFGSTREVVSRGSSGLGISATEQLVCVMDPNMGPRTLATTSKPALVAYASVSAPSAESPVPVHLERHGWTINLSQREERMFQPAIEALGNSQAFCVHARAARRCNKPTPATSLQVA